MTKKRYGHVKTSLQYNKIYCKNKLKYIESTVTHGWCTKILLWRLCMTSHIYFSSENELLWKFLYVVGIICITSSSSAIINKLIYVTISCTKLPEYFSMCFFSYSCKMKIKWSD